MLTISIEVIIEDDNTLSYDHYRPDDARKEVRVRKEVISGSLDHVVTEAQKVAEAAVKRWSS